MRGRIREIVADADGAFAADGLWPADDWDAWQTPTPLKALYVGAAGVVWALDALRRRGHAESRLDLADAARRDARRPGASEPDLMRGTELPDPARAGLFSGQSGILAVAWRLAPDERLADELHERVLENVDNEAIEVMWGSPGTMLAARAMFDWTGEERWAEAWRTSAARLLERARRGRPLGRSGSTAAPPAGSARRTASSATCSRCSAAATCSTPRRRTTLERDTAAVLAPHGCRRGRSRQLAQLGRPWSSSGRARSGCSGAAARRASSRPRRRTSTRICCSPPRRRSGGPVRTAPEKGAGICHGTAGNGYALLKVVRAHAGRGLARARAALRRARPRAGARHARARAAATRSGRATSASPLYAADCLDARPRYPIMETWD